MFIAIDSVVLRTCPGRDLHLPRAWCRPTASSKNASPNVPALVIGLARSPDR